MPEEIADDLVKQVSHQQDEAMLFVAASGGGGGGLTCLHKYMTC